VPGVCDGETSCVSSLMKNSWVYSRSPRADASQRLFCFPYAGGGAPIFHSWPDALPPTVEVCVIQLPGRGARLLEKPYRRMDSLVSALTDALAPLLDKPFALFGHSMGAWIGFELARRLRKERRVEPLHLFVSGASAPHLPQRDEPLHALPEEEFVSALRRLNGTPKEVLESDELMRLITPTLRADFAICENYSYVRRPLLSCPITAFSGSQDRRLRSGDIEAWREETTGPFRAQMFPGGHFFIHTATQPLLARLAQELDDAGRRL
jgi:medium-chain acyl-[acyl-carrier-protein] hydrolase